MIQILSLKDVVIMCSGSENSMVGLDYAHAWVKAINTPSMHNVYIYIWQWTAI